MNYTSDFKDCFEFFGPILNGIAFEFSRCYMQCSNETGRRDRLQRNMQISSVNSNRNEKVSRELLEEQHRYNYEVEKCRNASKRAYVENQYLTYLDLHDCLENETSSKNEMANMVGTGTGTGELRQFDFSQKTQRKQMCQIDSDGQNTMSGSTKIMTN